MELTWTRVANPATDITRYVARTAESDYVITGRYVTVVDNAGGVLRARRFVAHEVDTGAQIGTEVERLNDAIREVAEYLTDLADADVTRTPVATDSTDEELMEDLARSAARVDTGIAALNPRTQGPVTVEQAMTAVLHVARKLDTDTGDARTLGDLAHLTETLGQVIAARASVLSAEVVAQQHADAAAKRGPGDPMHLIASASRDTVQTARETSAAAWLRLANAIGAYGSR